MLAKRKDSVYSGLQSRDWLKVRTNGGKLTIQKRIETLARLCDRIFTPSVYRYLDQPRDDRAARQRMKEIAETASALRLQPHPHPAAARRLA